MDTKSYDQLLIIQATIGENRHDSNEKMEKLTEELTAMITSMADQINI